MRVLFFGSYDARIHPRVKVLQDGFAALGDQVIECNVPLGLGTADRVRILKRPLYLPLLALRLAITWLRLCWRSRTVGDVDVVVVGHMGHFDVRLARRRWPRTVIVLDFLVSGVETARDRRVQGGWRLRTLDWVDRAALRAAVVIMVDTPERARRLPVAVQDRTVVVPVGCPTAWFHRPRQVEPTSTLQVIFFGLYIPLQGAQTIGEALVLLAGQERLRLATPAA